MSAINRIEKLDEQQRDRLQNLLADFEQSWHPKLLGKTCKQLATEEDGNFRQVATQEIARIDLTQRWKSGKGPLLESYSKKLPDFGPTNSVHVDLILTEYKVRKELDAALRIESYESRFPDQYAELVRLTTDSQQTNVAVPQSTSDPVTRVPSAVETNRNSLGETGTQSTIRAMDMPEEFGRYRIIRELGSGAMGMVYLAHDSQLDREVALKTPSFDGKKDDILIARFEREARASARLLHRNICQVFDVGEIDGRHFLSMAYIKGSPLSDVIRSELPPDQKQSAKIVYRLAMALAEAHRHKIVHRDLKPANVMIDEFGEPVVMDFGLARHTEEQSRMTQSGMIIGTPAFMAPEQVKGDEIDVTPAVDIYALGVIFYELLTGQLPFTGSIAQVVYKITAEEPTPPSEIKSNIDPALEAICAKMMAKRIDERYQSMEQVATDLKRVHNGGSKTSPKLNRGGDFKKLSEQQLKMISGGIGAVVALIAIALFLPRLMSSKTVPEKAEIVEVPLERPFDPETWEIPPEPGANVDDVSQPDESIVQNKKADSDGPNVTTASQSLIKPQTKISNSTNTNSQKAALAALSHQPTTSASKVQTSESSQPQETIVTKVKDVSGPTTWIQEQVLKVAGPLPSKKTEIDNSEFSNIRKAIKDERRAVDVLNLYQAFTRIYQFNDYQQGRVDADLADFEERAAQDLYRFGGEWVPKSQVDDALAESRMLIEEAERAIGRRDYQETIDLLEKARRANPNGIRADYLLGLVHSLPAAGGTGPEKAADYFDSVLKWTPDSAAALNSRAIARMKSHDFRFAARDLERSQELVGSTQELKHNISRLLYLESQNRLSLDSRSKSDVQEASQKILGTQQSSPQAATTGWLHMIPSFPAEERTTNQSGGGNSTVFHLAGNGTGFFVAEDYLLTSRSLVEGAWTGFGLVDRVEIQLINSNGRSRTINGTVVAFSDQADLALVHVPNAGAKPLKFSNEAVDVSGKVVSFANSGSNRTQESESSISQVPSKLNDYYFFNSGFEQIAEGTPIINEAGQIVSVLDRGNRLIHSETPLAGGIPASVVVEFLSHHLKPQDDEFDFISEDPSTSSDRKDIRTGLAEIKVYYSSDVEQISLVAGVAGLQGRVYEDKTCVTCNGRQQIPCPNRKCVRGQITVRGTQTERIGVGTNFTEVQNKTVSKIDCRTCVGGNIECRACTNGIDNQL